MNTRNVAFNLETLENAFNLLSYRLNENKSDPVEIVVCGGCSLIVSGWVSRTTKDVDILALISSGKLLSPDPLPDSLCVAAREVAEDLDLQRDWLNNGPSRNPGGLFQMGLPEGLKHRLSTQSYSGHLTVHFIGRIDQIFLKLYASADRGGYHINDLLALQPEPEEIYDAAIWAMSHDVSAAFKIILKDLIGKLGYESVAERI